MAKPDLDDGYLRLAHELFAAMALGGFTKWEWAVLSEVLDQIYGLHKSHTAFLFPTVIAGKLGTYKESIVRAIRTLIDAGVLVRRGDAEVAFVKDYEKWKRGGEPRLSAAEVDHCMHRKRRIASNNPGNNGAPNHQSDPSDAGTTALPTRVVTSTKYGNNGAPGLGTDALPSGSAVVPQNDGCVGVPPENPHSGTPAGHARQERIENEEENKDDRPTASSPAPRPRPRTHARELEPPADPSTRTDVSPALRDAAMRHSSHKKPK